MATAAELDAQWEAQYKVVKQKNDERVAAVKALAASPAYQNGTEAERAALTKSGPAEDARLAFNAENQKLTALAKELETAKAAEKAAAEKQASKGETPPAPTEASQGDTAANAVEASQGTVETTPLTDDEVKRNNDSGNDTDENGESRGEDPVNLTNKSVLKAIGAGPSDDEQTTESYNIEITPGAPTTIEVVPNPLHAYSSYTYGLSWHMLTKDDFNAMATDPKGDWKPGHTLVASAGKYGGEGSGFERDDNFQDDFYFENFKMNSIIGSQAGNAGTNAVDISFTLIEPYGITLIDRMIDACVNEVDGKNYLEIPYLLVINFYGYDDEGNGQQIENQRKYIPLKLISMGIKAGIKGAEYSISGVPYAHSGFQESIGVAPANFEVVASTLQDFFKDDVTVDARTKASFNERQESDAKAQENESAQAEDAQTRETTQKRTALAGGKTDAEKKEDAGYTVQSFPAAYNTWQELTVKNNHATDFNTISVKFDNKILDAFNGEGGKIVYEKAQQKTQVAEKNPKNQKERAQTIQADAGKPTGQPDFKVSKWNVRGGDSITAIINNAMINSNYIRKQLIDPTKGVEQNAEELGKEGKDLLWWKIVPSVQMRKFCTKTSRWYMDITYHVISYTVNNRTHPNAPKSLPTGWHKDYQYLYTGHNNDIIDFSIEFDTAFYTAVSVDRGKNQSITTTPGPEEDTLDEQAPGKGNKDATQSPVTPNKQVMVAEQANATAGGQTKKDGKGVAAASLADQQNGGGGADQLSVRLKIVGDPQFIKQDDIYYTPAARQFESGEEAYGDGNVGGEDGSIAMDGGEIHVRLSWRTPTDIDEETGFMRSDSRYSTSAFSGIYKVISVESVLAQGKFEQTLELIRLPDQPNDFGSSGNSSTDIRTDIPQVLSASNADTGYEAVDSEGSNSVEVQKTKVMNGLMSPQNDENSNAGQVERANETDNEGSDPQTEKLQDVVNNGDTIQSVDDIPADSPTVKGVAEAGPVTTTVIPPYKAATAFVTSAASTKVPDAVSTIAAKTNISTDQIVSHPNYTSVYQAALANNTPPLLAAKQASDAAKAAIALGN